MCENHCHIIALYTMFHNFIRTHKTLQMSPASAAGVSSRLWSMKDLAESVLHLGEGAAAGRRRRGFPAFDRFAPANSAVSIETSRISGRKNLSGMDYLPISNGHVATLFLSPMRIAPKRSTFVSPRRGSRATPRATE
jgi:hypothetical protein